MTAAAIGLAGCGVAGGSGATENKAAADIFAAVNSEDPLAPVPLKEKQTLKVAVTTLISSYGAFLAANELGEFNKENLDVEVQIVPVQDAQVLLNQGRVDVALTGFSPGVLNLIDSGGDVKAVFPGGQRLAESTQGWYVNRQIFGSDGKFDPEDLKGATLGAPGGSSTGAMGYFFNAMREKGTDLKLDDIKFENLAVPDAVAALQRGALDVAYASAPFNVALQDDDCCEFIPNAIPTTTTVYTWFGKKLREDSPEAGLAFVRAMARTTMEDLQGDYRKDRTVLAALSEGLETPVEDLARLEPSVFDPELDLTVKNLEVYEGYYDELNALQYEDPLAVDEVYDSRFTEALTK
ncbi:ABC transporter substrate-binding protein [Arthrobacter sp. I2-34]|uniref:ABC transporter substrate-binding protein n=1 Tax=Arthrobacter hankyongi TaxID=2904801 RepID=A0ABS9L3V0_9MICC|nr:ABC transporter substrate-binding protein [Arthrobacter hankyongi]MCG2621311.1 ABC transporter substrate-binding protein [Arthrobacter hankyongi]